MTPVALCRTCGVPFLRPAAVIYESVLPRATFRCLSSFSEPQGSPRLHLSQSRDECMLVHGFWGWNSASVYSAECLPVPQLISYCDRRPVLAVALPYWLQAAPGSCLNAWLPAGSCGAWLMGGNSQDSPLMGLHIPGPSLLSLLPDPLSVQSLLGWPLLPQMPLCAPGTMPSLL